MTILQAIEQRHSVRAYTGKAIEPHIIEQLEQLISKCNGEGGLRIVLVQNEPHAFSCRMARYGRFSGIDTYIAMIGTEGDNFDERIGFYGERIVLEAQTLGLNTCWVGLTYSKKHLPVTLAQGERLRCLIALGYGTTQGKGHKIKSREQVSRNLSGGETPEWYVRGVDAALLAPTALNQQKFTFVLHPGNVVEAKRGRGFYTRTDLGIVMCHFQLAAGADNFTWQSPLRHTEQ